MNNKEIKPYKNGLAIGYCRVSTALQEAEGYSLEAQEKAIKEYCAYNGYELLETYSEQESGRKSDRAIVNKVLSLCNSKNATLVIARLDRFTRDLHFLTTVQKRCTKFVAVDNPSADSMVIQIMVSIAENESNIISKRTKSALAVAKSKGVELGNHQSIISNYHRLEQSGHELWDLFVEVRQAWDKTVVNHKHYEQFREWIDHAYDVVDTPWGWQEYIRKQKLFGVGTDYEESMDFYDEVGASLDYVALFGDRYKSGSFDRDAYHEFISDAFGINSVVETTISRPFHLPILDRKRKPLNTLNKEIEKQTGVEYYVNRFVRPKEIMLEGFKLPVNADDVLSIWRSISYFNTRFATESRVDTARDNASDKYRPIIDEAREKGIEGIRALGRYLESERVATPTGKEHWSPSSVQSVLKLLKDADDKKPLTDKYTEEIKKDINELNTAEVLAVWDAIRLGHKAKVQRIEGSYNDNWFPIKKAKEHKNRYKNL